MRCNPLGKVFEVDEGRPDNLPEVIHVLARSKGYSCSHLLRDGPRKFGRSNAIQRHRHHPAKDASIKSGDPLAAITPEHGAVSLLDAEAFEFTSDLSGGFSNLRVGPSDGSVTFAIHEGNVASIPPEFFDISGERGVGHETDINRCRAS